MVTDYYPKDGETINHPGITINAVTSKELDNDVKEVDLLVQNSHTVSYNIYGSKSSMLAMGVMLPLILKITKRRSHRYPSQLKRTNAAFLTI